jgi:transcriptional regulator with XRE-family HTH domain
MDFGALLRRERIRAGLSQQALASKCGVSAVYVYRLEKKAIDPPARKMCHALAKALGAEPKTLWQAAFASRLRRWLNKEGYRDFPEKAGTLLFEVLEDDSGSKQTK